MQHSTDNTDNGNKTMISTAVTRCAELSKQTTNLTTSARIMANQNFPQHHINPRFSLTPETMGINILSSNQAVCREYQQQQSHESPLVDVKSYYERRNMDKQLVGHLSDLKLERNTSCYSSQSNAPNSSYTSTKSESVSQHLSSKASPSTDIRSQQWNFDKTLRQEQTNPQTTGYSSSSLPCSSQTVQPLTSTVKFPSTNSPRMPSVCSNLQTVKSSEDPCVYHHSTSAIQDVRSTTEIPTSYFEQQLRKYQTGSNVCMGNSAEINYGTLNNMFLKRLQDIDANVWGDKNLKLVTFQEWVDMLLKINDSFITNMEELEKEVAERLELVQQKVNTKCRYSQGNELMKCRKDIDTLLKIIQNAYYNNSLDLRGITFETINPAQILPEEESLNMEGNGFMKNCNDSEVMQRNKLFANIKALAHEVAEKHDEVRELKRQIICLEDEIQNAQKKIQLKDNVIKELRNDLKCANNKLAVNNPLEANFNMPTPNNFQIQTACSGNTQITDCNALVDESCSQFDSLSHTEQEEQQKLKVLEEELNEFFAISRECNKQKMENQRKRLKDIFQTVELEKDNAYRKLDYIRRQLIDLESNNIEAINDYDSGFHSKSENDQDAKILDAIRKRLHKLTETNFELKKTVQKLELKNNELSTSLQSERCFSQRNNMTLKQIADLLSSLNTKQFSYIDIYNKSSSEINPFCEAIIGIQRAFQERENQLIKAIELKNEQIKELRMNGGKFNEEKEARFNLKNLDNVYEFKIATTQPLITAIQSSLTTPTQSHPATSVLTITTPTLSSSLTGQQLDNTTSFLQGPVEKN